MIHALSPFLLAALGANTIVPHDCPAEHIDYFVVREGPREETAVVFRETWGLDVAGTNEFARGADGLVTLTLRGTPEHDVADVDPTTIELWTSHCDQGPVEPLRYHYEDADGDGSLDLSLRFRRSDVQKTLGLDAHVPGTDVRIFLAARLESGRGILGQDRLRIR